MTGRLLADLHYSFGGTWSWLTTAAHWRGERGITHRLAEHLMISADAIAIALVIGLPVGLFVGHTRRGTFLAVNVSNVGRAIPSFAVLGLGVQVLHFGFRPALLAMVLLAVPPIVTNTYVGITGVDRDALEAARGMGLSGWQILRRVELPLAVPLVMAGIRTAAVQVVATATLAAYVAFGGLGRFVKDGIGQQDAPQLVGGCLLVAVLALATEVLLGQAQRLVTPKGLRTTTAAGLAELPV